VRLSGRHRSVTSVPVTPGDRRCMRIVHAMGAPSPQMRNEGDRRRPGSDLIHHPPGPTRALVDPDHWITPARRTDHRPTDVLRTLGARRASARGRLSSQRPTDAEHHPAGRSRLHPTYGNGHHVRVSPRLLGPTVDHCGLAGGRRRRHRWRPRAGTDAAELLSRGWRRRRGRRWRTGPRGRPGWRPAEPPGTRRRWCPAGPGSPWHWRRRWARSRG